MGDSSLADLEGFFLALSDGTRLRLLNLMRIGEVSVGYLSDELGQSQPKISRHLAYLRSAGLVETRRDGKWIYYRILKSSDRAMQVLDVAMDWVDQLSGRKTESESGPREIDLSQQVQRVNRIHEENEPYSNEIEIYLL
ncbi:MAG: metalloregulator ArsR/SmtB family transcription factor [Acidobacteriota bacterium]